MFITDSAQEDVDSTTVPVLRRQYEKTAQKAIAINITVLEKQLNALTEARDTGLGNKSIDNEIREIRMRLTTERKKMKSTESTAKRQKNIGTRRKPHFSACPKNTPTFPVSLNGVLQNVADHVWKKNSQNFLR